jgi:D-alanyl-D-alanine dipeptidase
METAGLSSVSSQWWRYELADGRRYAALNVAPDTPIERTN